MGDYKNIAQLSAKTGIHISTLSGRIAKGMTQEQAASFAPRVYAKGVQMKADFIGVTKKTIMRRMSEGKTLEQALTEPYFKRKIDVELVRSLVSDGMSLNNVAYVVKCSRFYLATFCKKHGIVSSYPTHKKAEIMVNGELCSQVQVCKRFGWSQGAFSSYISKRKNTMTIQACFESYKAFKESKNVPLD